MAKILFLADIVGSVGRKSVKALLPGIRAKLNPDLVIANAENAAGGFGFCGANRGGFPLGPAGNAALAAREVDDRHPVSLRRVQRDRSAAARLRVVRMAAHADNL